jgi:two-component sensor histidine kinase/GGDEF domain-containing protein
MIPTTSISKPSVSQEDLLALITHELRTPLTAIKASITMVTSGFHGVTNAEQRQALSTALASIDRLSRMLNDLLDLSRAEAGRLEVRRERVDLVQLMREVARTFEPLARERGLSIRFENIGNRVDTFIDRDKIVQVLTNLVHNAIKFTEKGAVTLSLSANGDYIECSVADTGRGIPADQLPHLFDKFHQIGRPSPSGEKGSGLGLALSRYLVELHGGRLQAESENGRGSRFTFYIPHHGPETLFDDEVRKLIVQAERESKPFSLVRFQLQNGPSAEQQLGCEAWATLLYHFEALIRSSLRGASDFVLQCDGAIWMAVFSVNKGEGVHILHRIQQTFESDPLYRSIRTPVDLKFRIVSFPDDAANAEALIQQLKAS